MSFLIVCYCKRCAVNILVNASSSHFICRMNTQKWNYWPFGTQAFEILIGIANLPSVECEPIYILTGNMGRAFLSTPLRTRYVIELLEFCQYDSVKSISL